METGFTGTFVISWSQTQMDGVRSVPPHALEEGAEWSWSGKAICVDQAYGVMRQEQANFDMSMRRRAAHSVHHLVGAAIHETLTTSIYDDPLPDQCIVVSDGRRSYTLTLIDTGTGGDPLLMFHNGVPPQDRTLWILHVSVGLRISRSIEQQRGGVICFTPGTRLSTPRGPILVEHLREGDFIQTRDNGPQQVQWIGSRRMTGARLFAMPHLRPIRIHAGALGSNRPDQELLVSPAHRMLIRGDAPRDLFNTPEVLVSAHELVDGYSVSVDHMVREVTYYHLLLPSHQIVWANGVETESYHPENEDLTTLSEADRGRLLSRFPDLGADPASYGGNARRAVSGPDAAILMHNAA